MTRKTESEHYRNAKRSLNLNNIEEFAKNVELISDVNEVNRDKESLAFFSVADDNLDALKILAEKGANLDIKDKNGWSLLHLAAGRNNLEIVSFLIEHGADVHAKDKFGNNVIWRATYSSEGDGGIIKLLLKSGADPTTKNNYGRNAIELANLIANYDIKQFFEDL